MTRHFEREIEHLKIHILRLSSVVEERVHDAVSALEDQNAALAQRVIDGDIEIDRSEVEIEEECLKILALHQPVAADLRFVVAVLKINSDLERIGDLAVNVAERASYLARRDMPDVAFDYSRMTAFAQAMLHMSIDSLVAMDAGRARQVCVMDDALDEMNREMYVKVQEAILRKPGDIESLLHLLSIARHLERMGDQATNIAEDVVYLVEGEIIRHRAEDYSDHQP